ncbi:MAG: hypothetical protein IPK32_26395 [Verrucomicrobiaceae bacterium]|nr:hypothetical protein [Verrucomicrobiaceae bacterium]
MEKAGTAPETAEPELYDYAQDPLETRNLAAEQPEVVEITPRHPRTAPGGTLKAGSHRSKGQHDP